MVVKTTYLEVYCDNCGEYLNDYDNGESAWKSYDEAKSAMYRHSWLEMMDGSCYCKHCRKTL